MTRDSLLRHIFKRGSISLKYRKRTRSAPLSNNESDESMILQSSHSACRPSPSSWRDEILDDHDDTCRIRRDHHNSSDSCSTTSATSSTTFSSFSSGLQNTLLPPHPWIRRTTSPLAISTRDLFFAVVQEAVAGTTLHMNTLDTALRMLETMQGLCATVDVLRGEMQEKRKACEVVRKELLQFGEVIRALGLVE